VSVFINLKCEMKAYGGADGDDVTRLIVLEASGVTVTSSLQPWTRMQVHGPALNADELAAFSKLIDGIAALHKAALAHDQPPPLVAGAAGAAKETR
jgi:hypothetical protein